VKILKVFCDDVDLGQIGPDKKKLSGPPANTMIPTVSSILFTFLGPDK